MRNAMEGRNNCCQLDGETFRRRVNSNVSFACEILVGSDLTERFHRCFFETPHMFLYEVFSMLVFSLGDARSVTVSIPGFSFLFVSAFDDIPAARVRGFYAAAPSQGGH